VPCISPDDWSSFFWYDRSRVNTAVRWRRSASRADPPPGKHLTRAPEAECIRASNLSRICFTHNLMFGHEKK